MNKLLNLLLMWTYAIEHFLLKRQEKLCYKVVREYGNKLAERKNIKLVVYYEINYYEGRDATIHFYTPGATNLQQRDLYHVISNDMDLTLRLYGFDFMVSSDPRYATKNIIFTNL